ncbi:B12-binding domain-containing radical SAM protein [Sphaerisporangium corydalis]|uniref:B12-binding domain-containing radical SAM protein n=1 Tax=Sphaerisporangium corydalis TaxID=1441875 RepID=A0ABV9ETA2_9ACTN|nr:radical SAM protein [Sphaerisporangium corydalis]
MIEADQPGEVRAVLLGLYSKNYPAIGESHGLSVAAGGLLASMPGSLFSMHVLDMVEWGEEDCGRAVDLIRAVRANVLAIGLAYGTFSTIERQYHALRSALDGPDPLVAFGGPIATYLGDRLLADVAPDAVLIVGEADEALPQLVEMWRLRRSYETVPNIHYIGPDGKRVRTRRLLVDLRAGIPPFRGHVRGIYKNGGQIFTETSRGCSWAACTFCLRGLNDVAGRAQEYRRKSAELVANDLNGLTELGVHDVTIADEDFLGGSLADAERFVEELAERKIAFPKMDASLTIHSVYSRRDSSAEDCRRARVVEHLADLGLQKVFLGIESCSPGQLKRYAKGHTRDEAAMAVERLLALGIRVEIGVILFDPLCSLSEIEESLRFMRAHGLAAMASGLSSSLRLQTSSHYLNMLEKYEQRFGVTLHESTMDPDTLSHRYVFAEADVNRFFRMIESWNQRLHPLYYPAKNLSRSGSTGIFGTAVHPLRQAIVDFRNDLCDAMLSAIGCLEQGQDPESELRTSLSEAAGALASCVQYAISTLRSGLADHAVVRQASIAAHDVDLLTSARSPARGILT